MIPLVGTTVIFRRQENGTKGDRFAPVEWAFPIHGITALKLMEEAGELAQAIGKFQGLSGEATVYDQGEVVSRISEELLDVAQTAVSMMFVLEELYDVDLDQAVNLHIQKLVAKGYLMP